MAKPRLKEIGAGTAGTFSVEWLGRGVEEGCGHVERQMGWGTPRASDNGWLPPKRPSLSAHRPGTDLHSRWAVLRNNRCLSLPSTAQWLRGRQRARFPVMLLWTVAFAPAVDGPLAARSTAEPFPGNPFLDLVAARSTAGPFPCNPFLDRGIRPCRRRPSGCAVDSGPVSL